MAGEIKKSKMEDKATINMEKEKDKIVKYVYVSVRHTVLTLLPNAYTSTLLAGCTSVTGDAVLDESLESGIRLCATSRRAGNWL
jgi:hypothetical protein